VAGSFGQRFDLRSVAEKAGLGGRLDQGRWQGRRVSDRVTSNGALSGRTGAGPITLCSIPMLY